MTLIASGTLTIAVARSGNGKNVTLPRTFNYFTGKETKRQTGFNDAAWGKTTRSYTTSARSLTKAKFHDIIEGAQPFINSKPRKKTAESSEVIEIVSDDECACLVAMSDDDDNCKFFSQPH